MAESKYLDQGGVSHLWDKVKAYLDNRFGTGTKINNNGFYVVVRGMTAYEAESLYIENECGLGMVATWGSSAVYVRNDSDKRIRGTWATLGSDYKGTFKLNPGDNTLLNTVINSVIFVVWMYDLDL